MLRHQHQLELCLNPLFIMGVFLLHVYIGPIFRGMCASKITSLQGRSSYYPCGKVLRPVLNF